MVFILYQKFSILHRFFSFKLSTIRKTTHDGRKKISSPFHCGLKIGQRSHFIPALILEVGTEAAKKIFFSFLVGDLRSCFVCWLVRLLLLLSLLLSLLLLLLLLIAGRYRRKCSPFWSVGQSLVTRSTKFLGSCSLSLFSSFIFLSFSF